MHSIRFLGLSLVWLAAVVTAAAVSLPAPRAVAAVSNDDKAKAREHYQRGLTHYDLKEYTEALAEFKNAYRLVQDPAFLFNIAQCHRRLGQNVEALDFYRNYLRRFPNAPARPEVERRVQEIERELVAHPPPTATTTAPPPPPPAATTPPGSKEPGATPPGASGGASAGSSPGTAPRALPAATEPPPVVTATGGSASGGANILTASPPPPESQDTDSARPIYGRWWFWTLVGVAVAGGVAGGLVYANRGEIGDCRDLPMCRTVP